MSKRKFLIPLAVFGLLMSSLVACGGGTASSKPVGGSSGGQIDSSEPAGDTSSDVGGNSSSSAAGTSSQQQGSSSQQASSSQQQDSSSQAGSSSQQGSSQQGSSSAAQADPAVSVSEVNVAKKENNVYLQIKGAAENIAQADFLWALALEHTGSASGGDSKEGFILGAAEFAAADYVLPATLNADGSYLFEYDLTGLSTFVAGSYFITAGVKGVGALEINVAKPEIEVLDANFRYYFRNDIGNKLTVCADELPPLSLTEATIVQQDEKIWAKVGGQVSSNAITQEVLDSYDSFVQFQNTSNWQNTKLSKANGDFHWALEGNKAYLYADVTFFAVGGLYNTHLNVKENSQANCKMEVEIDEHYNLQKADGSWIDINVYSKPSASGQNDFWGNLGFKVTAGKDPSVHYHDYSDLAKTNEAANDCAETKVYNCADATCDTSVIRWSALAFNAALSDSGLEKNSDNVRFKSGSVENKGGTAVTGSHIVYKINMKKAVANAGLAFRIKNTGGSGNTAPVFKAISGDSSLGAIANADGTFTTATHRYGLKVNGVEYLLGDDNYGDQKSVTGWFDWPVNFPLQAGVNTIDVFAYAGYRANMYEFQLTGFPRYDANAFEGYNATFTTEHCKVLVYSTKQYATETPVETNTCVAKDEEGNIVAYDPDDIELQPQVSFKVVCDAGYSCTVNNVTVTPTENYKNLKQNPDNKTGQEDIFRITKVKGDIAINIVAVQGEQAKGHKITFVATNCTVNVYIGPKNADGTNLDTPEDGVYYSRLKDSPYDIGFTTPQVNFEVVCDAGYEFTATPDENNKVDFITGDYNKFSDKGGYYNLTKIASDLTITITATSAQAPLALPVGTYHGMAKMAADGSMISTDLYLESNKMSLYVGTAFLVQEVSNFTWDGVNKKLSTEASSAGYGVVLSYNEGVFALESISDSSIAALFDSSYPVQLSGNCQFVDCGAMTLDEMNAMFVRRYDKNDGAGWQINKPSDNRISAVTVAGRAGLQCNVSPVVKLVSLSKTTLLHQFQEASLNQSVVGFIIQANLHSQ